MLHQYNANCINTIYINNLNEKIKIEELKKALQAVFAQFGDIVTIHASKNFKMRGQAFVAFKDKKGAVSAMQSMQGFPFFDKPLKIQLAKIDSDCISKLKGTYVKREPTNIIYEKKASVKKEKRIAINGNNPKNVLQPPCPATNQFAPKLDRESLAPSYSLSNKSSNICPVAPNQHLASIVLPPHPLFSVEPPRNNILFLSNLPSDTNQMLLSTLFQRFPGFREIRTVTGRQEIAFAEFSDESSAESAKNALQGFRLSPTHPINISFAKK